MNNITSDTCPNVCLNSMQKWSIGNYVRSILLSNTALTQYVGNDIYPLVAPENTEGSFIIYQRDKYSKTWTKLGVVEDVCHLVLTIVSDSYDLALYLASEVDNSLTGEHYTDDYDFHINLIDSTESFDDNKYIEVIMFEIK